MTNQMPAWNINDIWENVMKELKGEFQNDKFYEDFVKKTVVFRNIDNIIILKTVNQFTKKILANNYKQLIIQLFQKHTGKRFDIQFVTEEDEIEEINISSESNLNPDLTFDNYVVGEFNKNLYTAGQIMIKDPKGNNLLFIYGNTGTGKTHLINSIGIEIEKKGFNVRFMNGEDFVRKIYKILLEDSMKIEEFKDSFKDVDLLIVDDVQFFSNKEKINEIFFSIFNKLLNSKKSIILSSDKIPNELNIDGRMISRFNSGLTLMVKKPDVETVKEIIKRKIGEDHYENIFTSQSIEYIANRFNSDIRVLEGILKRIKFSLCMMDDTKLVNQEKIKEILENEIDQEYSSSNFKVSPNIIIQTICSSYGIAVEDVTSKSRGKQINFVRNVCIYVLREKNQLSYTKIGSYFSNRDHSTIMDSYKKMEELVAKDEDLRTFIENIIKRM